MRLVDLNPKWFAESGRNGQGITFDCPHCKSDRLAVAFANPLDGGPPVDLAPRVCWPLIVPPHTCAPGPVTVPPGVHWQRTGDSFETLTLSPSVDCSRSGHWHGFIRSGAIV